MAPTDPSNSNSEVSNTTFEYSLAEIEAQLRDLGIKDISATGLANFQKDLQQLVIADSTFDSATGKDLTDFDSTLEGEVIIENGNSNVLNDSPDRHLSNINRILNEEVPNNETNDDDAISIISTTASQRKTKRKTVRKGIITENEVDRDDLQSIHTVSDYMEPINPSRYRSVSDHQQKAVTHDITNDTYNTTNTIDNNDLAPNLYEEKIDDFVKALLEGDDTVLDNDLDSVSNLSMSQSMTADYKLASNLNKISKARSNNRNNAEIDVEKLPPPPSFMRPSTAPAAGRRVNWHDPVKRHAEYTKYWNRQPRCNPKRDHKKTTAIKWQVRNELADMVRENDERFVRAKEEMGDYQENYYG